MVQQVMSDKRALVLSIASIFLMATPAQAFEIETDNPDLSIRFDNTLRYNIGVRTKNPDQRIINTQGVSNSDLRFGRGDLITNRLDILSELDVAWRADYGFRVSTQAWYDGAYDRHEKTNPALPGAPGYSAYPGGRYTDYAKRWNIGPSGEILDAFVFGKFSLGDVETRFKVGRHNLYWGESLFSFVHGVSYGQGPVDVRKASANPGIEAKELYRPLNQISFTSVLSDTLSVSGQYFLEWEPSPLSDGGTYWGAADYVSLGGGTTLPPGFGGAPFVGINHRPKDRGDWGLMARWSPEWLDGSLGFYYREYSDKLPLFVWRPDFSSMGLDYLGKRTKLGGVSIAKNIGGVAVGGEVVYRQNTALLAGGMTTLGAEPVGDTWHALVNVVGATGKTAFFDSLIWMGELTYNRLAKVRKNGANFNSVNYACAGNPLNLSCATRDALGISVKVEPKWTQVMTGVDLSMPVSYSTGLHGVSPVSFGGYKGNGNFSIGLTADIHSEYMLTLAYNRAFAKRRTGAGNTISDAGGSYWWDRDNVTLTFKATF